MEMRCQSVDIFVPHVSATGGSQEPGDPSHTGLVHSSHGLGWGRGGERKLPRGSGPWTSPQEALAGSHHCHTQPRTGPLLGHRAGGSQQIWEEQMAAACPPHPYTPAGLGPTEF